MTTNMNRMILRAALMLTLAVMTFPTKAWAENIPYAVLTDNGDEAGTKTLTFKYEEHALAATNEWDVTNTAGQSGYEQPGWYDQRTNITKVVFDATFAGARPTSCIVWFSEFRNLATIVGLNNLNTSSVTNMAGMFNQCASLQSLDLSTFNTSNVTNMQGMFQACTNLTSITFGENFNTSNVTNMMSMFNSCTNLTSITFGENFNTSNVTNMQGMFQGCTNLTSITFGENFNTSNVINMNYMFVGCFSLQSLNLSKFNTNKVTNMSGLFEDCRSLTSLDLSSFNTVKVTNMSNMFWGCNELANISFGENFKTSNVGNMAFMFYGCTALTSLDLSKFDTEKVFAMNGMFYGCSGLTSLDLSNFNTGYVGKGDLDDGTKGNLVYMFNGCSSLKCLSIGKDFTVGSEIKTTKMFDGCTVLAEGMLFVRGTTAPTIQQNIFDGVFTNGMLFSNLNAMQLGASGPEEGLYTWKGGKFKSVGKVKIPYIDENGKLHDDDGTQTPTDTSDDCAEALPITSANGAVEYGAGWYYVAGDVNIHGRLKFTDDAHLILCDGTKMTCEDGIFGSHFFTIYGQSDDENTMGKQIVTAPNKSGISMYFLTINGGNVKITADRDGIFSPVVINGGIVEATSSSKSGINSQDITINGGHVKATGSGNSGCGIISSSVSVNGGHVEASGYWGISATSNVYINGGQVEATGNTYGIDGSHIVIGWTDPDNDYIKSTGGTAAYFSDVIIKTAEGQRFVAYNTESGSAASAIVSGYISDMMRPYYADAVLNEKYLRPLDGYWLTSSVVPADRTDNITETNPAGADFTITTGEGENTVTTPYYVYKASTDENPVSVAFAVEDLGQDGVEIMGTNVPTATLSSDRKQAAFAMPAKDVTVTGMKNYATGVKYLDWDDSKKKLVEKNTATDDNDANDKVYILDGTEEALGTAGQTTWYISNTPATTANPDGLSYNLLDLWDDVHLILADGSAMSVTSVTSNDRGGIYSEKGSITIYGQNNGTGVLKAEGSNGILTEHGNSSITINGGIVEATGQAGCGLETLYTSAESAITINGGHVTATGSEYGICICSESSVVTINGGQVEAIGGSKGICTPVIFENAIAFMTLGWTELTDYIKVNSYGSDGDVTIVAGKFFYDGSKVYGSATADYVFGAEGNATLDDIANKKLVPAVPIATDGVKYLAFTDNDAHRKLVGDDVQVYVVIGYDLAKGKVYLKAVEGNVIPKGLPVVIGNKTEDGDLPANIFILDGDDSQTTVEGLLKNYVSCDGTQTVQAYLDALFGEGASLSEYIPYLLTGGSFKSVDVKATDVIKKDVCLLFIPKWDVLMGKSAGTTNASTRSIGIGNGETTSLTPSPSPKGEGSDWYDLLGRKIKKPTKKGIYILKGKMVKK